MEKFWIIAVANEYNTINERFYTYDEAVTEARKRALIDTSKIYNVLELKGYAEGELSVSSDYNDKEEIVVIEAGKGDTINVHIKFEDSKGEPLDLKGCAVQFVVLPEPNSPDETAMYNGIKYYTDEVPLKPNQFTSNYTNFIVGSEVTRDIGTFWYQVRIIYNVTQPDDNSNSNDTTDEESTLTDDMKEVIDAPETSEPEETVVYQENKFIVK